MNEIGHGLWQRFLIGSNIQLEVMESTRNVFLQRVTGGVQGASLMEST